MKTLTAEMKEQLAVQKMSAMIAARMREVEEPIIKAEPKRKVRVVAERKIDFYRDGLNPVQDWDYVPTEEADSYLL